MFESMLNYFKRKLISFFKTLFWIAILSGMVILVLISIATDLGMRG